LWGIQAYGLPLQKSDKRKNRAGEEIRIWEVEYQGKSWTNKQFKRGGESRVP